MKVQEEKKFSKHTNNDESLIQTEQTQKATTGQQSSFKSMLSSMKSNWGTK
jgi:hypothetical protein